MINNSSPPTNWRDDFPAFKHFEEQQLIWLDSAATSQKPQVVINTLTHYYQCGASNVHRAQYSLAQKVTAAFEEVRHKVANFINAQTAEQIIFTRHTTEAINLLAQGLAKYLPNKGNIVISALEHHANLLPWQQLAKTKGLKLIILPITADGMIDLIAAKTLINKETKLVAVSQMSNVFGTLQPIKELIQLANTHQAISVIDGAQGIVHGETDVQELDCDFYAFSGHKLYAPEGAGILYGKAKSLSYLTPWQLGGEMVQTADYLQAKFYPAPLGFEAGTPSIGAVLGLGAALDYLTSQDRHAMHLYEASLHRYLLTHLKQRPQLCLLGKPDKGLVSFYIQGIHPADISQLLTEQNIAVRAGQHCCMPLYHLLALPGAIRVSLACYNNQADIDYFLMGLDKAIDLLT